MSDIKNIEQHYSLDERPFLEKVRGFCQLVDDRYSPYLTDFLNPREIQIVEDASGKLVWECPNCGNRDQTKMHVTRRTCGYIGTQFWNQGRTAEIRDRKLHL